MRGTRLAGICILALTATVGGLASAAVGSHMASARADTCNPQVIPDCGNSGGGGGGTSTSTPPPTTTHHKHVNRPPGPVTDLHGVVRPDRPGQITMVWRNPGARDLAEIVVRRGPAGDCPKTRNQGIPIGGTAVRTSQPDRTARRPSGYCYTVFAVDTANNVSAPAARSVAPPDVTPPSAPTGVLVSGTPGHVVVDWTASSGHPKDYIIRRSASGHCPPGPTRATPVDAVGSATTSVTDDSAVAGEHYCYAVFAVDAAGNVSHAGDSRPFTASTPAPTPAPAPTAPATPPAAHGGPHSSPLIPAELARLVAAIAVAVVVFCGIVLGGIRVLQNPRRRDQWTYGSRGASPWITIERYDPRALVIPAVIIVVGLLLMVALAGVVL
jgi:hypothetical protein